MCSFSIIKRNAFRVLLETALSRYPLNRCSRNGRFAAEKVSSAAAKRTRDTVQRRARAFSGITAAAARKRVNSVDGMEMSGTRNETGERDRSAEMVGGGGRRSGECGDGRRGARDGERSGRERYYTNGEEKHWERSTRACTDSTRGRRAEPPLVPASSQTNGPSPDVEVARFLRRSFKFTFTD